LKTWPIGWCWRIPKKLRVISGNARKTDKIDAEVLAVFFGLGHEPEGVSSMAALL